MVSLIQMKGEIEIITEDATRSAATVTKDQRYSSGERESDLNVVTHMEVMVVAAAAAGGGRRDVSDDMGIATLTVTRASRTNHCSTSQ